MIIWTVGSALPLLFQSFGTMKQAYSLMHDPQDVVDRPGAQNLKITSGAITFDAVHFHYGEKKLFEDKHVQIRGGEKVGLVGYTGAGKSTLAILANTPILILDEATSSLDSITEKYIQDSLNQLIQGRTTLVIAHRLSTLSQMDRILVFDKGKIVEEGTHAALMDKNGHYAHMWNMQVGGFLLQKPREGSI